jgi:hypothetical protein
LAILIGLFGNQLRLRDRMDASKSWIATEGEIVAS